jgi:hypothetical protein
MICIRLNGGLGNQMFQYSCGRALALANNTDLVFDISQLADRKSVIGTTCRSFELNIFNIDARIANTDEISRIKPILFRIINVFSVRTRLKGIQTKRYFIENGFLYNSAIVKVTGNCYLSGYWQSQKYFLEIESTIRRDFEFSQVLEGMNSDTYRKIKQNNSISIHIRRSDFVNNKFHDIHGTCSINYYYDAIKHIVSIVRDPVFFIFSDDIEWARTNLTLQYPYELVHGNTGKNSFIDMYLMSVCKHNIIANSSFSWWGAWLNKNPEKIVIAPRRWFSDEKLNLKTKDLIPESWIQL